jgi:hypothetical protein
VLGWVAGAMGGCSPVQNPAGAVACGTKLVLAVDASVRACPNNVTIRQAVKDFFATVEGTTTEVASTKKRLFFFFFFFFFFLWFVHNFVFSSGFFDDVRWCLC